MSSRDPTSPRDGADDCEQFYDAEDCSASVISNRPGLMMRRCTDFFESEATRVLGPWRTTEVEEKDSEAWLLVGRRHSVDERRDDMQTGKALFLRVLASRADGPWRTQTAAQANELQALEDSIVAMLKEQSTKLRATRDFWAARYASDSQYLERLSNCASGAAAIPFEQAEHETHWRESIGAAVQCSGAWAMRLPDLLKSHEEAACSLRRRVSQALVEPVEAGNLVRKSRSEVWPATANSSGFIQAIGGHDSDTGPDGSCLWNNVRRYLAACDSLHSSQVVALARVRREATRATRLGEEVTKALSSSDGSTSFSTLSSPLSASLCSTPTAKDIQHATGFHVIGAESSPSNVSHEDHLSTGIDLGPLIVHEVAVEVKTDDRWVDGYTLMTVDLWLHVWIGQSSSEGNPSLSLPLPKCCRRPVAAAFPEDSRCLEFRFAPPSKSSASWLRAVGNLIVGRQELIPQELAFRCQDQSTCDQLLTALELVEKLYPLLQ
eukprot:CAMPEP_0206535666 /NCGR_PEP_ID=MMETSP0325_2-20121206/6277_1 /ASSEMBLY_ACC=CAM_ASM_000347 /TAXON_ID=2866 /ORGANISM="Crypthecodinium cohnii, Strain Seligo" /LENGTH=492 /DNA_ID=CAMNT_0054032705 /DNA_START=1 /DNA_END=1479 /DNA_ORIENTATION=+